MAEAGVSGRLQDIAPAAMNAEQKRVYDKLVSGRRGRLPSPYKLWLRAPKLAEAQEALGTYLLHDGSLSKREVEIAVLVIARHINADYVFEAHRREGLDAGLSAAAINAIDRSEAPSFTDPREQAVYTTASVLCSKEQVDQSDYETALAVLSPAGIADVLALLGYYFSVAFVMKFHAVPPLRS